MAWSAPDSHVYGAAETVTASTLNTYVRLNLDALAQSVQCTESAGTGVTTPTILLKSKRAQYTYVTGGITVSYSGPAFPTSTDSVMVCVESNPPTSYVLQTLVVSGFSLKLYTSAGELGNGTVAFINWIAVGH